MRLENESGVVPPHSKVIPRLNGDLPMKWIAFAAVLALAVGCAEQPQPAEDSDETTQASVQTFNTHCPIMPDNEIDAQTPTVQWQGKTIGFCCEGCDKKFLALSDEEKEKALAAADKSESQPADPES
jgi:hypothetical protein